MDWLLLRGLARESAHWGGLLDRLRHDRPMDHFHTLDLPGTGLNNHLRSPSSIAETRDFVERAASQLPRPLSLLGMSLGGMVAIDWAQHRPDDCAALVLMGTSTGSSRPWQRLRARNWPAVAHLLLSGDSRKRELGILRLTSNQLLTDATLEEWLGIQENRPVTRANVIRQLYAAACFSPHPMPPQLPVLVLASRGDRLVDWQCSAALAAAWGSAFELHASAGHDLPLDAPDWIIDRIRKHFPPVAQEQ